MTEDDKTENGAAETPQMPQMKILAQFVRDLSFENAAVQNNLSSGLQPDIQVSVALDGRKRETDGQFDVVMKLKVDAKTKDDTPKPVFLLEIEYGGIFVIDNVPEAQLHPYLLIECPRMLFPFVRRIVSDVTRDGGYPPLNLDQVDFVALYRQQLAARAAHADAAGTA